MEKSTGFVMLTKQNIAETRDNVTTLLIYATVLVKPCKCKSIYTLDKAA